EYIHFKNTYTRFDKAALDKMFESRDRQHYFGNATNIGQSYYARKFSADFTIEMTRSVKEAIQTWIAHNQ
ncbi:MAG: hypothetical protein V3T90_03340, partial [Anaerolineae bacterium]